MPVRVSTPLLALKLPVIPLWPVNPRESSPAVNPELTRAVAPVRVAVAGDATVMLAVTRAAAAPAVTCKAADSIFARAGGWWRRGRRAALAP